MKTTSTLTGVKQIFIFCFSFLTCPALSQIELVKEINNSPGQGGNPTGFIEREGILYFIANDGEHGQELWRTNGSSNGTQLVKDINPGTAVGVASGAKMVVFNSKLYFIANDGEHGAELWSSYPTNTSMVEDLRPGINSNHIFNLTAVNNKLLFEASPEIGDTEWWRVNGDNSVEIVKDILPGSGGAQLQSPSVGLDRIFFEADDGGPLESQLWITDGTDVGTKPVEDVRVGTGQGIEYNGNIYLMAEGNPATDGFELFKADQGGASMVRNINPVEFGGSQPNAVDFHGMVYKGELYFNAYERTHADALWKTDGTEAGTIMVKDIYPGSNEEKGYIGVMKVYKDYLYFTADDGTPGIDLWRTDGTESGTVKVKDFGGGVSGNFHELDGKLYFIGNDGSYGNELWVTDGTEEGTNMVEDFNPGASLGVGGIIVFEGRIFLSGNGPSGYELYAYTPIDCEAPQIITHPSGDTINEGETIILSVVATGDALAYQWQKDNIDIPGANAPSFTINDATADDNGAYTCHISNTCTTVTSMKASVVVENIILAAEEADKNNAFAIFPNPANEWLRITMNIPKGNKETFISVFNMQGLRVMEGIVDINQDILNVGYLPPGFYQIIIRSSPSIAGSSRFSILR